MGGKSTQSSQQVTIPPDVLARYNSVNANAQTVAQTPFQLYGGNGVAAAAGSAPQASSFVAPVNSTQQAGIGQAVSSATEAQPYYGAATSSLGNAQAGVNPVNNAALGLTAASGEAVNPTNLDSASIMKYLSPYLGTVLGSTESLINQQNQQAASGAEGSAIASGAFGGDRAGIAQANLNQQQELAAGNIYSGIANQGFNTALGTAQQQQGVDLSAAQANRSALGAAGAQLAGIGNTAYTEGANTASEYAALGTGAQSAAESGAQAEIGAGTVEQQTTQAGDTALYNQFLQQQSYPFQTAQFLANIAEGTGALSGSTTTTTQPGGFFSDERLKEDVQTIGKTFDGQRIVRFRYKGEPHTRIGLIAQEVERHHPDAVGLHPSGYKVVEHGKATDAAAERGHFRRGGLAAHSDGGIVDVTHMGERYASGGNVTPLPGLGPVDYQAILQAQQSMYGGYGAGSPASAAGGPYGGAGRVPAPAAATPHLATASGQPERPQSVLNSAKGLTDLTGSGLHAYNEYIKASNHPSNQPSKKPAPATAVAPTATGLGAAETSSGSSSGAPGTGSDPTAVDPAAAAAAPPPAKISDNIPDQGLGAAIDSTEPAARGGHFADGGMPYAGDGIDIPDTAPDAKLIPAGPLPKSGSSGLGNLSSIAGIGKEVGSGLGSLFSDAGSAGEGLLTAGGDEGLGDAAVMLANRGGRAGRADGGSTSGDPLHGDVRQAPQGGLGDALHQLFLGPYSPSNPAPPPRTEKAGGGSSWGGGGGGSDWGAGGGSSWGDDPTDDDSPAAAYAAYTGTGKTPKTESKAPEAAPPPRAAPAPGLAATAPAPTVIPADSPPVPAQASPSAFESPLADPTDTRALGSAGTPPAPTSAAPSSTPGLGGAAAPAQPAAPAGGLKDKLKGIWDGIKSADSDTLQGAIPLLTGLAAMGTAPTRHLGVALSAGIGAGAQSYGQTKQQLADVANTQANTGVQTANIDQIVANTGVTRETAAQIAAGVANQGAFFRTGNGVAMVRLYNGVAVPESQWIQMGRPATQGAAQLRGAVTASNHGEAIPKTPAPAPIASAAPAPGVWQPAVAPESIAAVQRDAQTSAGLPGANQEAIRAHTQAQEATLAQNADAARQQGTQLTNLAREISKVPPNAVLTGGPLSSVKATALGYWNDVMRTVGQPNLQIRPDEVDEKAIADKLSTGLQFAQTSAAGQHSSMALESAAHAIPGTHVSRAAGLEMTSNLMIEKQRALDEQAYEQRVRQSVPDLTTYNADVARQQFRTQYSDQYYQAEKEHLKSFLDRSDLLEYAATGQLSPEETKSIDKYLGAPVSRYIYNR